jgi:hypothetical protein
MKLYTYRGHSIAVKPESHWAGWQTKARWEVYIDWQLVAAAHDPWKAASEHIDALCNRFPAGTTLSEILEYARHQEGK